MIVVVTLLQETLSPNAALSSCFSCSLAMVGGSKVPSLDHYSIHSHSVSSTNTMIYLFIDDIPVLVSRRYLFPELQTHIFNCIFNFSTWMPNKHLKLYMSMNKCPIFHCTHAPHSFLLRDHHTLSVVQKKNLRSFLNFFSPQISHAMHQEILCSLPSKYIQNWPTHHHYHWAQKPICCRHLL